MRFLTDFNEVFDDDCVWAVVPQNTFIYLESDPQPGDWVELFDYDGSWCLAVVLQRHANTIDCRIDWSSWKSMSFDGDGTAGGVLPGYSEAAQLRSTDPLAEAS